MSAYKPRKCEVPENKPTNKRFRPFNAIMLECKILNGDFRITNLQGVKESEIDKLFKGIARDYPKLISYVSGMCNDILNYDRSTDLKTNRKMLNVVLFAYVIQGFTRELSLLDNKNVESFIEEKKSCCDDIQEVNEYIDVLEEVESQQGDKKK